MMGIYRDMSLERSWKITASSSQTSSLTSKIYGFQTKYYNPDYFTLASSQLTCRKFVSDL